MLIVGGGLAGLTSALHLSKKGKHVLLIEKNTFPKHKVCGEYISNEVLPYLNSLGINPVEEGAKKITKVLLSTVKSNTINGILPLGGFGMSRFCMDELMAKKAKEKGVQMLQDTVEDITFKDSVFSVESKSGKHFYAKVVIGAFGKRSNLDVKLNRNFIQKKSPYLAVKTHVRGNFPKDLVALHNFKGGYCGVSKVETDAINLCYITSYSAFKKHKNIDEFQKEVVFKNLHLYKIFTHSEAVFEKPITISQISFETKKPVEDHILMCGDTAGMIHPLCGNGMSMAISSAKLASEETVRFLNGEINRKELENNYLRKWNKEFRMSEFLLSLVKRIPSLLPKIIRLTHGKSLQPL